MAFLARLSWLRRMPGAAGVASVAPVAVLILGILILGVFPAAAQQGQPSLRYFRIGTDASDGSYFPIGGLIASAISSPPGARPCDQGGSCGVPGLIAVAQSTRGSVENIELIDKGRLESALSQANAARDAYDGRDRFARAPVKKLRAIAGLYREVVHIVVRADSGIRSIDQLRHKRVGVGEEGSGTLLDAQEILEAYGVRRNAVQFRPLKPGQASDALKNGSIDAFFLVSGAPSLIVSELAETTPIRLLPVDGPKLTALRRAHPSFGIAAFPAGVYKDVPETQTLSVSAIWITSSDMSDDLIYGVTKALWDKSARKLLESGGPEGRQINLQTALDGVTIPLHPGAERYYREVGLLGGKAGDKPGDGKDGDKDDKDNKGSVPDEPKTPASGGGH